MKRLLAALTISIIILAGCNASPKPPDSVAAPASTKAPEASKPPKSAESVPAGQAAPGDPAAPPPSVDCLSNGPKPPKEARRVTVQRVVDGDTVELADGTKVRLVGINTPESVDPRRPVQAYGKEASAHAKELLQGKEILMLPGQTPKDKYGRTLAWLWLPDSTFVNGALVRDGYAQVYTFSDNPDHADLLLACQREAREANRGLWAIAEYHDGAQAAQMDRENTGGTVTGPSEPAPAPTPPAAGGSSGGNSGGGGDTGGGAGGIIITREPGAVQRGAIATVTVKTTAGASCRIVVTYKSGPSEAQGLEPRQANESGAVSWSWKVGPKTTVGRWPVEIGCGGSSVSTWLTVQ